MFRVTGKYSARFSNYFPSSFFLISHSLSFTFAYCLRGPTWRQRSRDPRLNRMSPWFPRFQDQSPSEVPQSQLVGVLDQAFVSFIQGATAMLTTFYECIGQLHDGFRFQWMTELCLWEILSPEFIRLQRAQLLTLFCPWSNLYPTELHYLFCSEKCQRGTTHDVMGRKAVSYYCWFATDVFCYRGYDMMCPSYQHLKRAFSSAQQTTQ